MGVSMSNILWGFNVYSTAVDGDPDLEELGASVPHCGHISR
jgi:hypothetical protein